MVCNSGLCISDKKWIKMRMKTSICLSNKGNEIITQCLFIIWLCLLLSNHHHCMCCHCQCLLHHICASRVNNDDVQQGLKTFSDDKDIHSSLGVAKETVKDLLNMFSTLQNNSCNNISKCILGYYMFTLTMAPKQMGT